MRTHERGAAVSKEGPLALICGGGTLPLAVANRLPHVAAAWCCLRCVARPTRLVSHVIRITGFISARSENSCALARAAGCRDVVFIGSLVRPSLWQVHPDLKAL